MKKHINLVMKVPMTNPITQSAYLDPRLVKVQSYRLENLK